MPILITKYNNDDAIVITKEIAKSIDFDDLSLLIKMMYLDPEFDRSAENIARFFNKGKNSINSSLRKLEKGGYLTRKPVREGNRITDWEYIFDTCEYKDSEIARGVKQNSEVTAVDNDSQYIRNEEIEKRDVEKNKCISNAQDYLLDSDSTTISCEKTKEKILDSNSSSGSKYFNYEGMVISENDHYELGKLIKACENHEIDASIPNLIRYVKKRYDPITRTFKTRHGDTIRSLYGFIVQSFNYKTEQDRLKNKNKNYSVSMARMYKDIPDDEKELPKLNRQLMEERQRELNKV